jgi:predicted GNAT family acetyltransferase
MSTLITTLSLNDENTLKKFFTLQISSYSAEAKVIQSFKIPPLQESFQNLKSCYENFIGIHENDKLVAAASYLLNSNDMKICRVIVHPKYFKKGYASSLLKNLINMESNKYLVSTAAKNIPACSLYEKLGFKLLSNLLVAEGIVISNYGILKTVNSNYSYQ